MTLRRRVGLALLGCVVAFGVLGPPLIAADPVHQDLLATLAPPGGGWWFGTDDLGRSILARTAAATGRSAGLATVCVALAWGIGAALGLAGAWWGGVGERIVLAVADVGMAFPGLLLTLLLVGLLGGGLGALLLGVSLAQGPFAIRSAHALAAGLVARPWVQAARHAGLGAPGILLRDVAPLLLPQMLTQAAFAVAGAVITIGALGFLGIGLSPPTPEWGMMIAEGAPYLADAPWMVAVPASALAAMVLGLILLADAPA
jgi:peptide/nickel transport system permease protein